MTALARGWPLALIVSALIGEHVAAQPRLDGVTPYRATYALFKQDKRVGESTFTLTYDAASRQYTFESRSTFRGLLRLAAPRPVIERSEFVMTGDAIRPIAFAYEDGSRRGTRNIALKFDWDSGVMTIDRREAASEVPIEPATLDRGSARVALMRDLERGKRSGTHMLADPDVVRAYDYAIESTAEIETALGEMTAHKIRQQRDGSSRHTLIWAAPSLAFVMLRMEQHREDRDTIAFVIESIEWLGGRDTPDRDD